MLWTTKLTSSGYKESDFGTTFARNVKKYNELSDTLDELKKAARKAIGDELDKINENIGIVKDAMDELNGKLCTNIQRMINNPDQIKANKERMAGFHKQKAAASTSTTTAEPAKTDPPPPPADPKDAKASSTSGPAPDPAKPTPPSPKPVPATGPAIPDPKKKKMSSAWGWGILAFIVGACTGVAINRAK